MAIDPDDVGELQKALNDAAGKASVLWTTFVTFALYLVIAIGSVTHRDLLLENPVKLPLLNVDLPLAGFFAVAPVLLIIFHAYLMLQLLALSQKALKYDDLLLQEVHHAKELEYIRQRTDAFPILQLLVGPTEQRKGLGGAMLRALSWTTLVGAPIATILLAHLTFLPYHSSPITWLLRLCLIGDMVLVVFVWKSLRLQDISKGIGKVGRIWRVSAIGAAGLVVLSSLFLAVFPGELIDRYVPAFGLREWLFSANPDEVVGNPHRLFSNRIIVPYQQIVDPEVVAKKAIALSLRGRDLKGAIFDGSDLRKVDFTGANLDGASLARSALDGGRFGCAPSGATLQCTSLKNAVLVYSNLTGVYAEKADFRGAFLGASTLTNANFESADFSHAHLDWVQGTDVGFRNATMTGANLEEAKFSSTDWRLGSDHSSDFRGIRAADAKAIRAAFSGKLRMANFDNADLREASFALSDLTLASLKSADLRGANLEQSTLFAAILDGAKLQGTNFDSTDLEGASLVGASMQLGFFLRTLLQGADLDRADFSGALMLNACVWNARGLPKLDLLEFEDLDNVTIPWASMRLFGADYYEHWLEVKLRDIGDRSIVERTKQQLSRMEQSGESSKQKTPTWKDQEAVQTTSHFGQDLLGFVAKVACEDDQAVLRLLEVRAGWSSHLDARELHAALRKMRKMESCKGLGSLPMWKWLDLDGLEAGNLKWDNAARPWRGDRVCTR